MSTNSKTNYKCDNFVPYTIGYLHYDGGEKIALTNTDLTPSEQQNYCTATDLNGISGQLRKLTNVVNIINHDPQLVFIPSRR